MTEVEKLKHRLFTEMKVTNFKVFWGDKAHEMTAEELAKEINSALDQIEQGRATELPDIDYSGE